MSPITFVMWKSAFTRVTWMSVITWISNHANIWATF
jgi:hypothetical protein